MAKKEQKTVSKSNIDLIINAMKKKMGGSLTSIFRLSDPDIPIVTRDVVPTGIATLDRALAVGGITRGVILEVWGNESSGKSSLCAHIASRFQKEIPDLDVIFIDTEHSLDTNYIERVHRVDPSKLLISQPDNAEHALDLTAEIVKSGLCSLVIVDSVAGLIPQKMLEGDMDQSTMGLLARLMSTGLNKIKNYTRLTNTTVIFTNQVRSNIGGYGSPNVTPGGKALRFYASQRIEIKKVGDIKKGDLIEGISIEAYLRKNKLGRPFQSGEFQMLFDEGFDTTHSLAVAAIDAGILSRSGAWIYYKGQNIAQGVDNLKNTMIENPTLYNEIEEAYKATYRKTSVSVIEDEDEGEFSEEVVEEDVSEEGREEIT